MVDWAQGHGGKEMMARLYVAAMVITMCGLANAATFNVPGDYPSIQEAIDAAGHYDEVVLAPGTYFESVSVSKPLTIRSLTTSSDTVIDGGSGSAIYCGVDGGSVVTIEGLTLTSSSRGIDLSYTSGGVRACTHAGWGRTGPFQETSGSGSGNSLTVQDCVIENNTGTDAGGLCRIGIGTAAISNCVFQGNTGTGYSGGAIRIDGGTIELQSNHFMENSAVRGAGIAIGNSANATLETCIFESNVATYGGAVFGWKGNFASCEFKNNSANNGGAMFLEGTNTFTFQIESCHFETNQSSNGGAIYLESCSAYISQCHLRGNVGMFGGGGIYVYGGGSNAMLQDTVVCGNTIDQIFGKWTGEGATCLSDDCIDLNQDNVPDACQCLGDISGDGQVNVQDVLTIISEWGSNSSTADLDENGIVDSTDLLIVLSDWGPCP